MSDANGCPHVLPLSSLFLDDRLPAPRRAAIEEHLRGCRSCRAEFRAHARVTARVRRLPREPVAADLAAQVRSRARPPRRMEVAAWRAAAALLLLAGLFAAYELGIVRGRRLASPPAVADPELEERGEREVARGRAARSLLSDVAAIDQLAAPLRRPLLAAQIRQFGLDDWALEPAAGDVDVAALVRRLEEALRSGDDGALLTLQRDVLASESQWPAHAPRDVGPRRKPSLSKESATAVADSFAELPRDQRVSLARLLDLKESWARGDLEPGVELARRDATAVKLGPLAPVFRTTLLLNASEAGEQELARALAAELDRTLQEFFRAR